MSSMPIEMPRIRAATSLPAALFAAAAAIPAEPAQWARTDDAYHPLSYGQLAARIRRVATGLLAAGVGRGERVVLLMENRPEWAVADYAAMAIGAVTVPLYCSYRPQDMRYVIEDAGARIVIASGGSLLAHVLQAVEACPDVGAVYALEPPDGHALVRPFAELEAADADMAAIEGRPSALDRHRPAPRIGWGRRMPV